MGLFKGFVDHHQSSVTFYLPPGPKCPPTRVSSPLRCNGFPNRHVGKRLPVEEREVGVEVGVREGVAVVDRRGR